MTLAPIGIAAALVLASAAPAAPAAPAQQSAVPNADLYLGADLSYVNEMEDRGAVFRKAGKPVDPFVLLRAEGGNIVRVRIWNDPRWTKYSNYADVLKTIRRAKAAGLQVLLDFHYSDDWADGEKQHAPAAWEKLGTAEQAKALYDYTRDILGKLAADRRGPLGAGLGLDRMQDPLGNRLELGKRRVVRPAQARGAPRVRIPARELPRMSIASSVPRGGRS